MANDFVVVNTDYLQPGEFYKIYIDSNATTVLIPQEKDIKFIEGSFKNKRYFEIEIPPTGLGILSINIFELIEENDTIELEEEVSSECDITTRKEKTSNKITVYIKATHAFDGRLAILYK